MHAVGACRGKMLNQVDTSALHSPRPNMKNDKLWERYGIYLLIKIQLHILGNKKMAFLIRSTLLIGQLYWLLPGRVCSYWTSTGLGVGFGCFCASCTDIKWNITLSPPSKLTIPGNRCGLFCISIITGEIRIALALLSASKPWCLLLKMPITCPASGLLFQCSHVEVCSLHSEVLIHWIGVSMLSGEVGLSAGCSQDILSG